MAETLDFSDDLIEWTTHTTENGFTYRVGAPKSGDLIQRPTIPDQEASFGGSLVNGLGILSNTATPPIEGLFQVAAIQPWTRVSWEPYPFVTKVKYRTEPSPWKPAGVDGLESYKIDTYYKTGSSYCLRFINKTGWEWHFQDQRGEIYRVVTVRNGEHFVDYDSPQPGIKWVKKAW